MMMTIEQAATIVAGVEAWNAETTTPRRQITLFNVEKPVYGLTPVTMHVYGSGTDGELFGEVVGEDTTMTVLLTHGGTVKHVVFSQ